MYAGRLEDDDRRERKGREYRGETQGWVGGKRLEKGEELRADGRRIE